MKIIGLLGGMSWESTAEYYRILNETVKDKLGGLHSAEILLYSVDFEPIEQLQRQGDWERAAAILAEGAQRLEQAGADLILLCTNTMHKVAEEIAAAISIPFLHIADVTARAVQQQGLSTVGLLGTRFTMEHSFYRERLEQQGLQVVLPDQPSRNEVHRIIYEELCLGSVNLDSRKQFTAVMQSLVDQGAQGIILGCTEIMLLVKPEDSPVPLFDTTAIHAQAAVELAMQI
ncbi:MAG TPA: aspartate/glutamate racemase family protein [Trichocoleus sp.]